ncbi:hypothetical protein C468_05051 [Halorubrum kocurii JCM 14978]|uniref:Uncharacterized protein n=1 Tax=Halorubrum kocurii JCM 14978 TaxID=1230456 RepID=M0P8J3_9EURY|nr:hypothetical protein C468_05051 [Halorubrum kocurii JCM 14978]
MVFRSRRKCISNFGIVNKRYRVYVMNWTVLLKKAVQNYASKISNSGYKLLVANFHAKLKKKWMVGKCP